MLKPRRKFSFTFSNLYNFKFLKLLLLTFLHLYLKSLVIENGSIVTYWAQILFFWGPAGKIIRMTNSAHGGNVGGRQCQTCTD